MKVMPTKKSPLKKKPLRYAGQSLDEEINRILDDKIGFHILIVIFFITLALFEWYRWFLKISFNPLVFTIVAAVIATYSTRRMYILKKSIKRLRMARDGEKIVGESLELLREKGYRVFHDIVGDDFNIDHVLVGQRGIFTIETKTVSKPKGQAEIHYDGNEIKIGGYRPDRDPIVQAEAQANWLKRLLQDLTGKNFRIQPVILYPGWFISPQPKGAKIWVLNDKALPAFLENERSDLRSDEVFEIAAHLSQYVRNFKSQEN